MGWHRAGASAPASPRYGTVKRDDLIEVYINLELARFPAGEEKKKRKEFKSIADQLSNEELTGRIQFLCELPLLTRKPLIVPVLVN